MNERIKLGKYMSAFEYPQVIGHKTKVWEVLDSHDGTLGHVRWYTSWRQYVFKPTEGSVFNIACMLDLVNFINTQNNLHKGKVRQVGCHCWVTKRGDPCMHDAK